jgi:hypothetical protein
MLSGCSAPGEDGALGIGETRQAVTTVVDDQVMRVVGRQLLDSNGVPFLTRGIEGWFGDNAQSHIPELVDGIASQGFNAARMQLLTTDLTKIEALIKRFHSKNMVVYLVDANMPIAPEVEWFKLQETRDMVAANRRNLVIDATIEEPGNCQSDADIAAWVVAQKAVIDKFRAWEYTEPLTIGVPDQGRCLRAILDHGQELVDHDPLHSLILNAQMYWGAYTSGFSYQEANGFSAGNTGIREATAEVASKPFLIQFGLDAQDSGGNWAAVPYSLLMTEAQNKGIGTMWWEWKDPGEDNPNSLVTDQLDPTSLTPLGDIVINTHAKSIKNTSKTVWPCGQLPEGKRLAPGQSVTSCGGHWAMVARANPTDANLVLKYDSRLMGRIVLGAEDTLPAAPNHTFSSLSMQGDGNLVAYYKKDGVTTPTWASNTFGDDFYAQITNNGAVRVVSASAGEQWHSRDLFKPPAKEACGRLVAGEMIGGSEVSGAPTVLSCNGQFGFALISSGTPSAADAPYGSSTWRANSTAGSGGSLVVGAVSNGQFTRTRSLNVPRAAGRSPAVGGFMQGDGNLVVRDNLGNPLGDTLWASNTYGNDGAYLDVTNDGKVRIVSSTGTVIKTILNPP